MIARVHLIIVYVISLVAMLCAPIRSEAVEPGMRLYKAANAVSPEQARAYYSSKRAARLNAAAADTAYTTEISPEIKELARALHNDPYLIYNYVHNYIDYVPYYGLLKGPTLTYLDGSGNDFDQASLMVALLRASGYANVSYVYGTATLDQEAVANWLGITNNEIKDLNDPAIFAIWSALADGGIPMTSCTYECFMKTDADVVNCINSCSNTNMITIDRVWVRVEINNKKCNFDPAFKNYNYFPSKIGEVMHYDRNAFLATAANPAKGYLAGSVLYKDKNGEPIGEAAGFIQNLSEADMLDKLKEYSTDLIEQIRTNYATKDIKEIIGGRSIIQEDITECKDMSYATATQEPWGEIPEEYIAKIKIRHKGINRQFYMPEVAGKRLTVTYSGGKPRLTLDEIVKDYGNNKNMGNPLFIEVDHPYANQNICYKLKDECYSKYKDKLVYADPKDDTCYNKDDRCYSDEVSRYSVKNGSTYAIVSNFGGASDALIRQRQLLLNDNIAQKKSSEAVLGESLNIMGLTYVKEVQMANMLLSSIAETIYVQHHLIGLMAQEKSYHIDMATHALTITSKHNDNGDLLHFKVGTVIASAFEHAILEQMTKNPGVSTVKLLRTANANKERIFLIRNQSQMDGLYFVRGSEDAKMPSLKNYEDAVWKVMKTEVDNGATLIVPENGKSKVNEWQGYGYIAFNNSSSAMVINGFNGGECTVDGKIIPLDVSNQSCTNVVNTFNAENIYNQVTLAKLMVGADPVDMASGAYLNEHTDLTLGGQAPLGLAFTRFYNSNRRFNEGSLGYGWTHNYDIKITEGSHGEPGLGGRQAVDAAAAITALYISLDLMKDYDSLPDDYDKIARWMVILLSNNWAVEQLIDNAVTVNMGSKVMEFIKLPDGSYSPPPGITAQLMKNIMPKPQCTINKKQHRASCKSLKMSDLLK